MTQENENIDATDRSAAPGGGNSDGEQRKDVERIADSQGASGEAADSAYDPDITATIPVVRPKGAKGSKKKASKGGKGSKAAGARGSSKARGAALSASTTSGKDGAKADAASREAARKPSGGDAAQAEAGAKFEAAAKATSAARAVSAAKAEAETKPTARAEVETKPTVAGEPEAASKPATASEPAADSEPAAAAKSPLAAKAEAAAQPDSGGKRPVAPGLSASATPAAAAAANDVASKADRAAGREEPVSPAQKAVDAADVAAADPAATSVQASAPAPKAEKAEKAGSAFARVAGAADVASETASTPAKAGESHVSAAKAGDSLKAGSALKADNALKAGNAPKDGSAPKAADDASKAAKDVAAASEDVAATGKDDAAATKDYATPRAEDRARSEGLRPTRGAVSDRASAGSATSAASAPETGGAASARRTAPSAQPPSPSAGWPEEAKPASSAAEQNRAQGPVNAAGSSAAPAAGAVPGQSANASLAEGLAARVGKEGVRQEAVGESRPASEGPKPEAPYPLESNVDKEPKAGEEPHAGKESDIGAGVEAGREIDAGAVAAEEGGETPSVSDLSDDDTATIPAVKRSIAAQPVVYGPGAEAWQQHRQPSAGKTDDRTPESTQSAPARSDSQAAEIERSPIQEAGSPTAGARGSYWDAADDAAATTAPPAVQSASSAALPPFAGAAESEPPASEFESGASAAETAAGKETARDSGSGVGVMEPADSVAESRSGLAESGHGPADSEAAVAEPGRGVAGPEGAVAESAQGVAEPDPALAEPAQGVAEPEAADLESGVAGSEPAVAESAPAAGFSLPENWRDLAEPSVQAQPPAQENSAPADVSAPADASAPAETSTSRPTVSGGAAPIRGSKPEASPSSVDGGLSSLEASAERTAEKLRKGEASDGEPAKRRRAWLWVAVAALVFGVVYLGAAFYFSNKIPGSTTVAGVKVGGMSREAAQAKLESELSGRLSQPVKVSIGGKEQTIDPSSIGAKFDAKSTVDSLAGFSLNPLRLWDSMTGGSEVSPTVDVDQAKLRKTVDSLVDASVNTPTNASIEFDGVTPKTTKAKKGVDLDREEASKKIAEKMLEGKTIPLPVNEKEPDIKDSEAQRALKDLAKPLVSGNLTVKVGSATVTLTPKQLVSVTKFVASDGELKLKLDPEKLSDVVRKGAPTLLKEGKDAKIEIVDHTTPKVVPSEDGVGFDEGKLAESAAEAATTGDRKVEIATKSVPAKFTTEDAEKMGVKEVVSSIETPLTNDAVRTTNLKVGTQKVANTLVKPDEEFSLLKALGPIDAAHGFVSSGVVANGFNSTALGGGLSQLSTNTFNLGYRAGFVDVEHKPHSKYFSRYPMGMESTLWEGKYDMRFKNNTPYGAVIDTWVADGKVYSKLWSTKYWDVETSTSKPYAQVAPTTKVNPARDCEPSGAGGPGFTVTVSRKVSRDGKVHENSSYKWTYSPTNRVVCK